MPTTYFKDITCPLFRVLASLVAQQWRICLQCRRYRRLRFNPWVGKIPWRREWQPTLVFLPGESHGQSGLAGYSPRGCKESDTTEATEHTLEGLSPQGKPPWQEAEGARRHRWHLFLGKTMRNARLSLICILPIHVVNSSHTSVWWFNKELLHVCSKNYIKSVPKLDILYRHQQDGKYVPAQTDNAVLYCN